MVAAGPLGCQKWFPAVKFGTARTKFGQGRTTLATKSIHGQGEAILAAKNIHGQGEAFLAAKSIHGQGEAILATKIYPEKDQFLA